MMKSPELAVRSRATAPQGGAVFCKSVGVLQAAVRNELWLISEHRLRAPPGGPCLFWNAALVPTEGASAASDVAPARGTLSSGMEPPQAREQRVGRRRVAVCQGDRRFAPIVPAAASMTQPVKPREQRVCAGRIPGGK